VEYRVIQVVSYLRVCTTKRPLESSNVSFMTIDIGFCRAVIQSLDTERADLPLLYSRWSGVGYVESVTELSD
jgi:hypothetical protein